jgi:DNA-binding CsgD family transcriptional regulator
MSGNELQELCDQVERDFAAGDHDGALALIGAQGPAIWYGLRPERLRSILEVAIVHGAQKSPLARRLQLFVTAGNPHQFSAETLHKLTTSNDPLAITLARTAQVIDLRLRGRAHVAADLLRDLEESGLRVTPLFDSTAGWQLVLSLQCGITAMLAGRFSEALRYFMAARIHPIVPTLVFLTRDALVKSALIHAFFGDPVEARTLLDEAGRLPRTMSWAEPVVDAHAAVAEARLCADLAHGQEILRAVEVRDVGEMWPFYILALRHLMPTPSHTQELKQQLALFEGLGFPRVDGEGLTGSTFPLLRAELNLRQGNLHEAELFISQADPEFAFTKLLSARLAWLDGRAMNAVRIASEIEQDTGLRQVHLFQQAILADSFASSNKTQGAITALTSAMNVRGGIRATETQAFSLQSRLIAEAEISGWPHTNTSERLSVLEPSTPFSLTKKEREIVELLATNLSRAEIAAQQFISVNTLKSHITRLYKKLQVSSREEAVHRAKLEGWA